MTAFLKVIYVLAMAALLTMLVAFGIPTFYEAPEFQASEPPNPPEGWDWSAHPYPYDVWVWPAYPYPHEIPAEQEWTEEEQEYWEAYQEWEEEQHECWEAYWDAMRVYHRNVLFIAYPFGLLFVILGLVLPHRLDIMRTGLLLGGVATIIYAVLQGFGDISNALRFGAIAISLVVLIFLGYRTLIERGQPAESTAEEKEGV